MLISIFSSLQSFLFFNQKRSKFSLNACTHTHTHTHTESHLHMQSLALYSSKTGRHRHKHTNKSFAYSATMTSIFSLCNMTCLARCTSEKASLCPTTQVSVFSHIKPVLFSTGSNKSPVKTATMRVKFSGYSVSR